MDRSDDWCFRVKDRIIQEEKVGGEGYDILYIPLEIWREKGFQSGLLLRKHTFPFIDIRSLHPRNGMPY